MRLGLGILACLALALSAAAQTPQACQGLRRHGKLAEARQCSAKLAASSDPYTRAEGHWGLGQYEDANREFRLAIDRQPKNADCRVGWGRLLLERFNKQEAAQLFQEALEIQPGHPGALLGLALAASEDFENKAVALAEKAIAGDPKLVEARELLARLALEDGDTSRALDQADQALAISPEALNAMAIHATVDWLGEGKSSPWMDRILKLNPVYGEAYAIAARFFVLSRRYDEGIRFYRQALELNPELWSARSQLGINLMRLGEDAEARRQLATCYQNGYRDYATVNSLRLLDSYKNFVFYKTGRTVLKLHQKEAEVLRPYFESELERALAAYERKYKFHLAQPVQVEVYPDHEDFAVRALGMPGLGALGVTFGYVVAMDSPSGRSQGSFHWASTLWHELSHVYVLTMTNHRVPRWFTEGLAVHEETSAAPDWGDRLDPETILALGGKKLLPVAQLDRGFVRPSYPAQVMVSYFQAGRICDYIARTWGEDKLVEMIRAFAQVKATPEVIRETLGVSAEELDKRFQASLEADTRKTVEGFEQWRKGMSEVAELAKAGKYEEVIREAPALRDLYPDYVEAHSAYELLSDAYLAKGDKAAALTQLLGYSKTGGRSPALVKKLAALLEEAGRQKEAAEALNRLNYIDPLDEELHRRLGGLWLAQKNVEGAIREYTAALALNPLDQAASHYSLACAFRAADRPDRAKEQLLLALEAAPGYRPAQRMLLELMKN